MNIRLIDSLIKRLDAGADTIAKPRPMIALYPERCILILDRSGSMGATDYPVTRLLAALDAAIEFVSVKLQREFSDLVSIILFDDGAEIVCEDVSLSEAIGCLRRLKVSNPIAGGTDLNAGIAAAEEIFQNHREGFKNRIVLLTDGQGGNPIRTAERLRRSGVVIDSIGVAGDPSSVDEATLIKISSVIDGRSRYRFIANKAELINHFKSIATNLRMVR